MWMGRSFELKVKDVESMTDVVRRVVCEMRWDGIMRGKIMGALFTVATGFT